MRITLAALLISNAFSRDSVVDLEASLEKPRTKPLTLEKHTDESGQAGSQLVLGVRQVLTGNHAQDPGKITVHRLLDGCLPNDLQELPGEDFPLPAGR